MPSEDEVRLTPEFVTETLFEQMVTTKLSQLSETRSEEILRLEHQIKILRKQLHHINADSQRSGEKSKNVNSVFKRLSALSISEKSTSLDGELKSRGTNSHTTSARPSSGDMAHKILSFLCTKNAFKENFSQTIGDMKQEVEELRNEGKIWEPRWKTFIHYVGLCLQVCGVVKDAIRKRLSNSLGQSDRGVK